MEKYLRLYAEPECAALEPLLSQRKGEHAWDQVLAIPACDEKPGLLRQPPPCQGRCLLILVINEKEGASEAVSSANQELADTVHRKFTQTWQSAASFDQFQISLFNSADQLHDVLLVDRFSQGRKLPDKGGVGHARKIAADLAALLFHHGQIRSSWVHCSDGDTRLPDTYFTSSAGFGQSHSALVYPYRHVDNLESADRIEINQSTQRYELSLRYYVAGLKFAESPYAFHTIGSTMAVNLHHYAKVRGYPRRDAGEDFYLLNKLAKVGKVHEFDLDSTCKPIEIESRRSSRVPFGTGAAVNTITALDEPASHYLYYHPRIFSLLQAWIHSLPALWETRSTALHAGLFCSGDSEEHDAQALSEALVSIGTGKALEHAFRQSKEYEQFQRHIHTWFDAFRTLKFVHRQRDYYLPSVNLDELGLIPEFRHLLGQNEDLRQLHRKVSQM